MAAFRFRSVARLRHADPGGVCRRARALGRAADGRAARRRSDTVSGTGVSVRRAAVAGLFYPGTADELNATLDALLEAVPQQALKPKAMIVPHAGYQYSGPVAAQAYGSLRSA